MPLRRASVQRHLAPTDKPFSSVRLCRDADVFVLSEGMRGFVCPLAPVISVSQVAVLCLLEAVGSQCCPLCVLPSAVFCVETKTSFGVTLT